MRANPSPSEVRHVDTDGEASFVPMEAVGTWGGLDLSQSRQVEQVASGYTYFRNGDVVVAKITPCFENGKGALASGLLNGIAFGTTELHVLRPRKSIDERFLFYLTLSDAFRRLGGAAMYGAGGQKRVPDSFFRNSKQPLPPMEEQRIIGRFLDRETARIDGLIAKKQQLIDLLEEKRSGLVEAAVRAAAGTETRLRHAVDILAGYAFPSDAFSHDAADIRLLRGVNISPDSIRWDDVVYWPSSDFTTYSEYLLKEGDLVFGMDRPWIEAGVRVAEVQKHDVPSLLLQRVARLRPKLGLSRQYLKLLLSSRQFQSYFEPVLNGR